MAQIWLGSGRWHIKASFANGISCIHLKTLLSMLFTVAALSTAAKAKNVHFVGESPPSVEKTLQISPFLPRLPHPGWKRIWNVFNREITKQYPWLYCKSKYLSRKKSTFLGKNCLFVPIIPHSLPQNAPNPKSSQNEKLRHYSSYPGKRHFFIKKVIFSLNIQNRYVIIQTAIEMAD